MRSLVLHFEDKEFEKLKKARGERTWRNFVLDMAIKDKGNKR